MNASLLWLLAKVTFRFWPSVCTLTYIIPGRRWLQRRPSRCLLRYWPCCDRILPNLILPAISATLRKRSVLCAPSLVRFLWKCYSFQKFCCKSRIHSCFIMQFFDCLQKLKSISICLLFLHNTSRKIFKICLPDWHVSWTSGCGKKTYDWMNFLLLEKL